GLGLGPVYDWDAWLRCGRGLGLWPAWFNADDGSWPSRINLTGFLLGHKTGLIPPEIAASLGEEVPPVLVTGGAGSYMTREYFAAAIHGCRLLGRRAIVIAPDRALLPAELPPSTVVTDFVEFADVFPRVAAVVHHGGIATCGEALAAGVPQLVMGAWFDRPYNAAQLQRLGVAEYLPPARATPETVAAALSRLVSNEGVRVRASEIAKRMEDDDSHDALVASLVLSVGGEDVVRAGIGAPSKNQERAFLAQQSEEKMKALSPTKRTLLALALRHEQRTGHLAIEPARREGDLPVSHLQDGILQWTALRRPSAAMNLTFSAWLEGALDVDAFDRATAEVVRRHEVLRTRFVPLASGYAQRIDPPPAHPLTVIDLRQLAARDARAEAQRILQEDSFRSFRLAEEHGARWTLVRESESSALCIVTIHQAACGPFDVTRLWSELADYYDRLSLRETLLPTKPVLEYTDYAIWLRAWLAGAGAPKVESCRRRFAGATPVD
ncbi:MAG: condensation domain-containing protein, partial [Polyangiaceae bacterium]